MCGYCKVSLTKLESELNKRLKAVEQQIQWMRRILEVHGVSGPWLSPQKAADLLGVSRSLIVERIKSAESGRANGLTYGEHYRNIAAQDASEPTWQVHLLNFEGHLNSKTPRSASSERK